MQTTKRNYAVVLNVYDLNAANDWTHGVGVGFYHSGVEVAGREWTFGSGSGSGTGVMEHRPRDIELPLRESIPLGETELSATEIEKVAWDLGRDFFQAARYNLLMCNCEPCAGTSGRVPGCWFGRCCEADGCRLSLTRSPKCSGVAGNHFTAAYLTELGLAQPGWVNRAAFLGSWVACLLPKQLLTNSTVGGDPAATSTSHVAKKSTQAFSGAGQKIGSTGSSTGAGSSGGGMDESRNAMRERAVQAALARERAQAGQAE